MSKGDIYRAVCEAVMEYFSQPSSGIELGQYEAQIIAADTLYRLETLIVRAHPLLLEGSIRLQANDRSELLPSINIEATA